MSLGVEEALGLEVVEGSNVPVDLFEASLGLVIIDFSMPGFISDFPFLVAVFPHEADNAKGPRKTSVLILDLDVVVLEILQLEGGPALGPPVWEEVVQPYRSLTVEYLCDPLGYSVVGNRCTLEPMVQPPQ
ncbi:hypothetical protein IV203_016109 [Nitzschia inconspicua]|uniref:Uncharacterized protein n=1 Tax=Nitzschia inconspicua TaxID=303405 RepID=A0A9K3KPC6_9STRA|nr:hypothetical protein IV203_016109 [Nitzschia inconspicua]